MLRPVEHTRVSQGAVKQIVNLIRSHRLNPGDRLPGERQLVESLSVSRASVREALRSLEGMGLIEVRAGVGTFVKHPISEFVETTLPHPLLLNREMLTKLFELRELIETGAAAMAASRATDDDIDKIREAVEHVETCYEKRDLHSMVEADIALHRAILIATGNDILVQVMDNMSGILWEMRRASLSIVEGVTQTMAGHRAILVALEQHQPEVARKAMQEHLRVVAAKFESAEFTETGEIVYKDSAQW